MSSSEIVGASPSAPAPDVKELFKRAESAFRAGDYATADALYRQLYANQVSPGLMLWRLAAIANSRGELDQAWGLYHQAVAVDPKLATAVTPADFPHHNLVCRPHYDTEEVPLCPVCGSPDQQPLMVVGYLDWSLCHAAFPPVRRWVRCEACAHAFANPRPSAAALQEAYRELPPKQFLTWQYVQLTLYSDIVHRLWEQRPGGDWLDVGVASGGLAGVAMDFGYRVAGLDINPIYADSVRRVGVEFLLGDITTYDFGGRQFDIVSLGDVIEHVADPKFVIARVMRLVKPGGLIWLSTPNYEGVWTRALRDKDGMWKECEHLQFFCLRSLRRLLEDQGWRISDYNLSKRYVGCAEIVAQRQPPAY